MIDSHCHLEQDEYYGRLQELICEWKKSLRYIVSSCAHVKDLNKTIEIHSLYKPFVNICIGLHPEFIKELKDEDIARVVKYIRTNIRDIVAIGEVGLDYHWIKEPEFRVKQKELFIKFIRLAKELNLPLVVHSWQATSDAVFILEQEHMKNHKVLFHLLQDKNSVQKIKENGWLISIGPSLLKSKDIKKIARDMPIERILLETDSPWFKQEGQEFGEPINVILVTKKIAEIKHISPEQVEMQTDKNAIEFFRLK